MNPGLVLCHGCFDWLHLGHLQHLEEARKLGNWLAVSVTADEFIKKGPGRPIFKATQRVEMLRALKIVDRVFLNPHPTAINLITEIEPEYYVKGPDYRNSDDRWLALEIAAVRRHGGSVRFTKTTEFHTTQLLERIHAA